MSQKHLFDRIYNIILTKGSGPTIEALNAMYECYIRHGHGNTLQVDNAAYVRREFVRILEEAQDYRDESSSRGIIATDRDFFERQKIASDLLVPDLTIVENKETIFYDKSVVVTGVFSKYPNRNFLAEKLRNLGADINTAISKKTNIVCLGGNGVGPAKMAKVIELKSEGYDIIVLEEYEVYEILDNSKI